MKDRRKKVFLMSVLSFLLIASIAYIFLIINAVEDVKKRSYLVSSYTPGQRALLPVFKYLGMIENESIASLAKSLIPDDFKKIDEMFSTSTDSTAVNSQQDFSSSGLSKDVSVSHRGSSNYSGVYYKGNEAFKPSSKLQSVLSGEVTFSGGGSNTSQNLSSLSGSFSQNLNNKNISIDKNAPTSLNQSQGSGNLIARLNYTKSSLGSALKSKSADAARLDWERGFSGSVKPEGGMFYKDAAIELDKIKSGVADLKIENAKGLHSPEVSAPKIESTAPPDKAKEMLKNLTQDIAKSMINSLGNAIGGGGGAAEEEDPRKNPNTIIAEDKAASNLTKTDENKIKAEVEKWKFDPNENVTTTYFSCGAVNCDKLGINGDGFYKAYFPDGFVLTLNSSGKVLDYYYCVSPVNESAFLQNYQKYVVGK